MPSVEVKKTCLVAHDHDLMQKKDRNGKKERGNMGKLVGEM